MHSLNIHLKDGFHFSFFLSALFLSSTHNGINNISHYGPPVIYLEDFSVFTTFFPKRFHFSRLSNCWSHRKRLQFFFLSFILFGWWNRITHEDSERHFSFSLIQTLQRIFLPTLHVCEKNSAIYDFRKRNFMLSIWFLLQGSSLTRQLNCSTE